MVNIAKVGDSAVKFTFTDNDHYLFNGEIEVPLNSLILVLDESNLVNFKKIDGDPFVSFLISNSNFDSKEALETFYKENMVGSTGGGGGGVSSATVQVMIDESISGKADTSAVTESISEAISGKADTSAVTASIAAAVSGKADTSALTAVDNVLTAHTANTNIHVTTAQTAAWDAKQAQLTAGSGITIDSNNTISCTVTGGGNNVIEVTQAKYDALVSAGTVDLTALYVITDAPEIDINNYYTSAQTNSAITAAVSGKADSSAVTESINAAVSGKADSSAVTDAISAAVSGKMDTSAFTAYSASTDARISQDEEVTARALVEVNDALSGKADVSGVTAEIAAAVSGKQDTLSAGTNITISGNVISAEGGGKAISAGTNISVTTGATADTINCTIPAYFNSDEQKGDIAIGTRINNTHSDYYKVIIGRQIDTYGNSNSSYSVGIAPATNNSSYYSQLKGNNAVGIGKYFKITGNGSVAIGSNTESSVENGVAIGHNTVVSGTTKTNLNNQIKVDTSNQVYIYNKDNTEMICLQDYLQVKVVQISQSDYDQLQNKDANTLYVITNS